MVGHRQGRYRISALVGSVSTTKICGTNDYWVAEFLRVKPATPRATQAGSLCYATLGFRTIERSLRAISVAIPVPSDAKSIGLRQDPHSGVLSGDPSSALLEIGLRSHGRECLQVSCVPEKRRSQRQLTFFWTLLVG